ncbi:MAG: glutamate racemase [Candidatus Omnitrophica bacterium]|nr:glutamate racemase [Candidatus Omnitrophota bacterium]MBD3268610.1 glutamate racemase [Candidatus Omnitrophota bacterium]
MKKRPIGIFDSGVGGLTVLREIEKILPCEDIIYFGDTARVPYGNKSTSTIKKFSTENTLFLLQKRVKMVVVACNTSSALALDYLQDIFNLPIIGVIEAGVRKAVEFSSKGKIGVIGTRSTIESGSYEGSILKLNRKLKVYNRTCPVFVPLVEEGILKGKLVDEAIKMYLDYFKRKKIDTIILGCTHYPLLKRQISGYLKNVFVVDSAKEVAGHARNILQNNDLLNPLKKEGRKRFYVSDESRNFINLARLFLKRKISKPRMINV